MSWQKWAVVTFSAELWGIQRFLKGILWWEFRKYVSVGTSLLLDVSNDVYVFLRYLDIVVHVMKGLVEVSACYLDLRNKLAKFCGIII